MAETQVKFDDGEAYERYMGRWSRAIGEKFLAWLAPPNNASWLEIGCGTGAFTSLILKQCAPEKIVAIDPSPQQVEHARQTIKTPQAEFRSGTAVYLPFRIDEFDLVTSALVIHFIPDRAKAFREMLRVTRPGGNISGYTWRKSPSIMDAPYGPLARAVVEIAGDVTTSPVVPEAMPDGLNATLTAAGYHDIEIATLEASQTFRDFEDYWNTQTAFQHPVAKSVAAMSATDRDKVRAIVRKTLPPAADGSITYASRAVAFKARKSSEAEPQG